MSVGCNLFSTVSSINDHSGSPTPPPPAHQYEFDFSDDLNSFNIAILKYIIEEN